MTVPNLTPAAWAADAPAGSKLLPPKKRLLPKLDLIEMGISVWNFAGNCSIIRHIFGFLQSLVGNHQRDSAGV